MEETQGTVVENYIQSLFTTPNQRLTHTPKVGIMSMKDRKREMPEEFYEEYSNFFCQYYLGLPGNEE